MDGIDTTDCPLIVDLDGTLIYTDMLQESALQVLRDDPAGMLGSPYWLTHGKATLKENLARRITFDPSTLPYNQDFLSWLTQQRAAGRKLILCTGSDLSIATVIAKHVGLFDEVMASDGKTNLTGKNKANALVERFGKSGFDYAGNASIDLKVWRCARRAIVVNASAKLIQQAPTCCEVERIFPSPDKNANTWYRVLRAHQWLKNLLLFVPLLAAHQIRNLHGWQDLVFAFLAFCSCASAVYIANDLMDLESDRRHPHKRNRPFASGIVSLASGIILAPLLLFLSIILSRYVGNSFQPWLMVYFVLSCAYSWRLKRVVLLDCLTLAMMYTLRIIAGAAAVGMPLSPWLLAFSIFLFLSLAFVKRYAELRLRASEPNQQPHGRGYYVSDAPLIQMQGIASGYACVLVLALYLNSNAILLLYRTPEVIWGTVPIMLFWISWVWLQAHRGNMHDDPLIFAVKDKSSWFAAAAFAAVLVIGATGWSW